MCVAFFAGQSHPDYPLILIHNRDEFYSRPTAPAAFWGEAPSLLAGKDLKQGGIWLGVTTSGRWGFVTNYRNPKERRPDARTRGTLVLEYLLEDLTPREYSEEVLASASDYNGFNLLVGTRNEMAYLSSVKKQVLPIPPGVHGISNGDLNTPWPKVVRGQDEFERILERGESTWADAFFALMKDETPAPDAQLPNTGVGPEMEKQLSPLFIRTPNYGTRATTLLMLGRTQGKLIERTYDVLRGGWTDKRFSFPLK